MSEFKLGARSLRELEGVHPDLVAVVKRAIELTSQDFSVHDGIRTMEEQREMVGARRQPDLKFQTYHRPCGGPGALHQRQIALGVGTDL